MILRMGRRPRLRSSGPSQTSWRCDGIAPAYCHTVGLSDSERYHTIIAKERTTGVTKEDSQVQMYVPYAWACLDQNVP